MLVLNKGLEKELQEVCFPDLENSEQETYLQNHLKRIFYTFNSISKLKLAKKASIVDLGAKPYLLAYLVKKYSDFHFTGVGYSIKEIRGEKANQAFYQKLPIISTELEMKYKDESYTFPMWQVNIESEKEPFSDKSFDLVVCTETVEHLLQDPKFLLDEIYRILKPGGHLIFSVPNATYWGRILNLATGKNIDDPYSIHGPYARHNRNYTKKEVQEMIEKAGLKRVRLKSMNFTELKPSLKKKLIRGIGNTIFSLSNARLGKTIFGVFKKAHDKTDRY